MKYLPLIWAGLWRKPLRTILTMLALVVAFVLFGLLQGINAGFNAMRANSRMDAMYVIPRFGTPMPMAYKEQIAQIPGVKSVTAAAFVGGIMNGDPKKQFFVLFADNGFFDFYDWLNTTPAQVAELRGNRSAIIVGKATADRLGVKAGDHVTLKSAVAKKSGGTDWAVDIIAIADRKDIPNGASVSVGNYEFLNEERVSGADTANQYMVLTNDPDISVAIAKAIDDKFLNSGAPTRTFIDKLNVEQGYEDDNIHTMVNDIVLATLFSLLLMTGNSMMQSFRERVPEFGTLKALGFSDRQVLGVVLAEAIVQCLIGGGAGIALARVMLPHIKKLLPGPTALMTIPWSLVGLGLAVACLVALVSAAVPAWRAGRMEIVNALAAR